MKGSAAIAAYLPMELTLARQPNGFCTITLMPGL